MPKRTKKRGAIISTDGKRNTFINLFPEFQEHFQSLDESEREDFIARANEVLDDYDLGDCLNEAEVDSI